MIAEQCIDDMRLLKNLRNQQNEIREILYSYLWVVKFFAGLQILSYRLSKPKVKI